MEIPSFFLQTIEGVERTEALPKFPARLLSQTKPTTALYDGMENKGKLEEWINKPGLLWKKLIAQLDVIYNNSMVEAANKILKYRFLYPKQVANTDELIIVLKNAVRSYNQIPNAQLYGFTPNEVLLGSLPDKHHFKPQIALGIKQRLTENQNFPCKMVCQT